MEGFTYCTICGTVYKEKIIDKLQDKYCKFCHQTLIGSGNLKLFCGHSYSDLIHVKRKI